jgi:hypothetical protein
VNRFIGSALIVITISSYTLKITVIVAYVTSHTVSYNSSSGHRALPLELRNSSEVNSEGAEQKQKLTDGNQPALSLLVSGPAWTTGHISVQCQDVCVLFFVVSPFS